MEYVIAETPRVKISERSEIKEQPFGNGCKLHPVALSHNNTLKKKVCYKNVSFLKVLHEYISQLCCGRRRCFLDQTAFQ